MQFGVQNVCKFRQTAGGKAKQQILEQCWFSGT